MKGKARKKAGLPPGTLIYAGNKTEKEKARITLFSFNEEIFEEKECADVEECFQFFEKKNNVNWLNIDGLHETEVVEKIGKMLNIHPLTQEDILNTEQRPKIEEYAEYIYIVLKMIYPDGSGDDLLSEQVSILLGANYVVTFQEVKGDIFAPVKERLRTGKGRVRTMSADYLAYLLMDALVDNYFIILEKFGEEIEGIEEVLLKNPQTETLHRIHNLKWDLLSMRKSLWPLREEINNLIKTESSLVKQSTFLYLRDLYDHTIRAVEIIETLRDLISGMLEIYLSSISNRMNEVMKVLTLIATIFMPLTLVVGIYGMNFEFMPELHIRWAYPAVLFLMLGVGVGMVFYFKKRKWL